MDQQKASSGETEVGRVHVGRDGVLFLTGGQHGVMDLFSGARRASRTSIDTLISNIDGRVAACRDKGLGGQTFIFPDKIFALRDHLALEPRPRLQSLFERDYAPNLGAAAEHVHYLIDDMDGNRAAYLDLDTHQSPVGCTLHMSRILDRIAPGRRPLFEDRLARVPRRTVTYRGDLGQKVRGDMSADVDLYVMSRTGTKKAGTSIKGGNDGLMILSENPNVADGRLLIFGDSFFRQLVPYLALCFRFVMFCRTRYFHTEMIDAVSPDVVVCGMAERYLSSCSPDSSRPHFLTYPLIKGRALDTPPEFAQLWNKHIDSTRLAGVPPA